VLILALIFGVPAPIPTKIPSIPSNETLSDADTDSAQRTSAASNETLYGAETDSVRGFVLIGNSMLESRIDLGTFEALTDQRDSQLLIDSGAGSAA